MLGQIAQNFTLKELVDPSNQSQLLLQVLSQVSNLFFNVIDDHIQECAATTIALTLNQLLNTDNLGLDGNASGGITFIQTN